MRLTLPLTLGMAAIVVAAACGGGQPDVAVGPDPDSLAREQARRDSIAAAERARQDSIRRAEEERMRGAREDSVNAARAAGEAVRAMVAQRVHFDFDMSNIRPGEDTRVLEQKLAILQANPALRIEIVGHCDERGSDEYNLALGNRRALSAKRFLTDRGIDPGRVTTASMGEEQPVDPASNEAAWALNRRDEFRITAGGDNLMRPGGM